MYREKTTGFDYPSRCGTAQGRASDAVAILGHHGLRIGLLAGLDV